MDTGPRQQASVALFGSSEYEPIADYNGNPVAAFWEEKCLCDGRERSKTRRSR